MERQPQHTLVISIVKSILGSWSWMGKCTWALRSIPNLWEKVKQRRDSAMISLRNILYPTKSMDTHDSLIDSQKHNPFNWGGKFEMLECPIYMLENMNIVLNTILRWLSTNGAKWIWKKVVDMSLLMTPITLWGERDATKCNKYIVSWCGWPRAS